MSHRWICVLLLLVLANIALSSIGHEGDTKKDLFRIPGAYIVHLEASHTHTQFERHLVDRFPSSPELYQRPDIAGRNITERFIPRVTHRYFDVVHGLAVENVGDDESALAKLRAIPGVLYVVPDTRKRLLNVPSWGLDRIDQTSLPLNGFYNHAVDGSGVDVYVVDTGLDTTHVEFQGGESRTVTNIYNAFIANKQQPSSVTDDVGHGTHVAGTIGGNTVGVSPGCNLLGVKVLDADGGGSTSAITAALDFVLARVQTTHRPSIVTMSLGGPCEPIANCARDTLVIAAEKLSAKGIIVSLAAGNEGCNGCQGSPNAAPNAVNVGASDIHDKVAFFSNFGQCIDLFAPGYDITSACSSLICTGTTSAYKSLSGTSMACPHVTGTIAQLLHLNPTASPSVITKALECDSAKNQLSLDPRDTISRNMLLNVPSTPDDTMGCNRGYHCPSDCTGKGVCQQHRFPNGTLAGTLQCLCDPNAYGPTCADTSVASCNPSTSDYVTVDMVDTFGDGWTFSSFSIRNQHGYVLNNAFDSLCYGESGSKRYCVPKNALFQFDVSRGYFPSEVAWTMCGVNGGAPFHGEFTLSADSQCNQRCSANRGSLQTLVLQDSYGDGWNGAYYSIFTSTGVQVFGGTLVDGTSLDHQLCIPVGTSYFMILREGEIPAEVSVALQQPDESGNVLETFKTGQVWTLAVDESTHQFTATNVQSSGPKADSCPAATSYVAFYKFDLATDGWGDITYSFSDPTSGQIVASSSLVDGFVEIDNLCLPDGCYDFEVRANSTNVPSKESFWFACGYRGLVPTSSRVCVEREYALCYGIDGCPWVKSYEPHASLQHLLISQNDEESNTPVLHVAVNVHGVVDLCGLEDGCYDIIVGSGRDVHVSGAGLGHVQTSCSGATSMPLQSQGKLCLATNKVTNSTSCTLNDVQPFTCAATSDYPIIVTKIDGYGDGWGRSIQYKISDSTSQDVVAFSTLEDGAYGVDKICLNIGSCYLMSVTTGMNADEVVWMMCGYIGGADVQNLMFCVTTNGCYFTNVDASTYNKLVDDDFPQPTLPPIPVPSAAPSVSLAPNFVAATPAPSSTEGSYYYTYYASNVSDVPSVSVAPTSDNSTYYYAPYYAAPDASEAPTEAYYTYAYSYSDVPTESYQYYYGEDSGSRVPTAVPSPKPKDEIINYGYYVYYYGYGGYGDGTSHPAANIGRKNVASASIAVTLKVRSPSLSAYQSIGPADLQFLSFAVWHLLATSGSLTVWDVSSFVAAGSSRKMTTTSAGVQVNDGRTGLVEPVKLTAAEYSHNRGQNEHYVGHYRRNRYQLDNLLDEPRSQSQPQSRQQQLFNRWQKTAAENKLTIDTSSVTSDSKATSSISGSRGLSSSDVVLSLSVHIVALFEWETPLDDRSDASVASLVTSALNGGNNGGNDQQTLQKCVENAFSTLSKSSSGKINAVSVTQQQGGTATSDVSVTFHTYPNSIKSQPGDGYSQVDWSLSPVGGNFDVGGANQHQLGPSSGGSDGSSGPAMSSGTVTLIVLAIVFSVGLIAAGTVYRILQNKQRVAYGTLRSSSSSSSHDDWSNRGISGGPVILGDTPSNNSEHGGRRSSANSDGNILIDIFRKSRGGLRSHSSNNSGSSHGVNSSRKAPLSSGHDGDNDSETVYFDHGVQMFATSPSNKNSSRWSAANDSDV